MSFDRIVGHRDALALLRKRLDSETLPHALLFTGPAGVGKRTTALELGRILLCGAKTGRPCGRCASCGKAERLAHPDLVVIAPGESGQLGIAEIRGLIGRFQLKPFEAHAQAAIIDGAEAMTEEAQNSFLKLLEEPPAGVYLVLVASDTSRLYATVVSRCQKIAFGALSAAEVEKVLCGIPDIGPAAAARLAERSWGSAEAALKRREFDGAGIEDGVFSLIRSAARGDTAELPERGKTKREEALFEIDTAANLFRDLYLLKTAPAAAAGRLHFKDRAGELEEMLPAFTEAAIERSLGAAGEAREAIERSGNPRLVFAGLWLNCGVKFF